ncbi:MAG: hypothetical protein KJP00_00275 [Bacteroidia bacterium]|nr:hypothetical protein [Bacteroidia bacterium]
MITRICLFLFTLHFVQPALADDVLQGRLEGYWQNDQYDFTLEIRETRNGIDVLRLDRNDRWYSYEALGRNTFMDRDGNRYQLINDNTLTFRDDRQRLRLTFQKSYRNDYGNDAWNDDRYGNYDYGRNDRSRIGILQRLEGRWRSPRQGIRLTIDRRGSTLKVSTRNLRSTFRLRRQNLFTDQYGNEIKILTNNRIKLTTRGNNRKSIIFNRDRRSNDYCPDGNYNTRDYRWDD